MYSIIICKALFLLFTILSDLLVCTSPWEEVLRYRYYTYKGENCELGTQCISLHQIARVHNSSFHQFITLSPQKEVHYICKCQNCKLGTNCSPLHVTLSMYCLFGAMYFTRSLHFALVTKGGFADLLCFPFLKSSQKKFLFMQLTRFDLSWRIQLTIYLGYFQNQVHLITSLLFIYFKYPFFKQKNQEEYFHFKYHDIRACCDSQKGRPRLKMQTKIQLDISILSSLKT